MFSGPKDMKDCTLFSFGQPVSASRPAAAHLRQPAATSAAILLGDPRSISDIAEPLIDEIVI